MRGKMEHMFHYQDVTYGVAAGWVDGVYHPRAAQVKEGVCPESRDGLRRFHSRVWQEMEETGYGIFYYEETTQLAAAFPGSNYTVKAVLANPARDPYNCHIRFNGVVKAESITVEPGQEREVAFTACLTDGGFALSFPTGAMEEIHGEVLEGDVYVKNIEVCPEEAKMRREKPHLFLISDSTVQSYGERFRPQTGWGQVLCQFFKGAEQCQVSQVEGCSYSVAKAYELPGLVIENRAIAGRSARSFYDEGRLDQAMEKLCPGDYMFVQFAHNDDNALRPNRYIAPEEFPLFLQRYVDACDRRGAQCVLVTAVTMMVQGEDGKFQIAFPDYREKMMEYAREWNIPLLDLGGRSTAYLNEIGPEEGKSVYLWAEEGEYPDSSYAGGVSDRAHLQEYGAKVYANMVVELMMEYQADDRLDTLKKLAAPKTAWELAREKPAGSAGSGTQGRDGRTVSDTPAASEIPGGAGKPQAAEISRDAVSGFVVQEVSVENGRGNFLLNWNQTEGAEAYSVYARRKGEAAFRKVKTVTRQEKDAYATLPFSAQAGTVWEYCVAAVFEGGREGQAGRTAEVDLRGM